MQRFRGSLFRRNADAAADVIVVALGARVLGESSAMADGTVGLAQRNEITDQQPRIGGSVGRLGPRQVHPMASRAAGARRPDQVRLVRKVREIAHARIAALSFPVDHTLSLDRIHAVAFGARTHSDVTCQFPK